MRKQRGVLVVAVILVAVLLASPLLATSKSANSSQTAASFVWCELVWCLPIVYYWQGNMTVSYTASGTDTIITREDQSVWMNNIRSNNPCNIWLGVSTDVYRDRGAAKVGTIYRARSGSYLVPSSSIIWGGITDLMMRVRAPRLRANATASIGPGSTCLGWKNLSWTLDL